MQVSFLFFFFYFVLGYGPAKTFSWSVAGALVGVYLLSQHAPHLAAKIKIIK